MEEFVGRAAARNRAACVDEDTLIALDGLGLGRASGEQREQQQQDECPVVGRATASGLSQSNHY